MKKRKQKQRKYITLILVLFLVILTTGYAAFQTTLNINVKGNIQTKKITIAQLKEKVVTQGDGLYKDEVEENRYIYKGAKPDNYIIFNNELWRIVAIEEDNALKIIKNEIIITKAYDSKDLRTQGYCTKNSGQGCNAWMQTTNFNNGTIKGAVEKDAELNSYLNNNYYNSLSSENQQLTISYKWNVGPVEYNNDNLTTQITSEKTNLWTGKVGAITVSDYLKANTNIEECATHHLNQTNSAKCKTTNYIQDIVETSPNNRLWTISPAANVVYGNYYIDNTGYIYNNYGGITGSNTICGVSPTIYLKQNLTLSGNGTKENPYQIQ